MQLSVIIPTLNEAPNLERLLPYLWKEGGEKVREVIVVDAGSTDLTCDIARKHGAMTYNPKEQGRAIQMNQGADFARGDIFYFVHADTFPPPDYASYILQEAEAGWPAGCFTSIFDWPHPLLRFCNFFSRFPFWFCRGGGQTLYILDDLFIKLGGYDESMVLMEEYDLIRRIRQTSRFRIMTGVHAVTSARDYRVNGAIRLQAIYACVFLLYALGASQHRMMNFLRRRVRK